MAGGIELAKAYVQIVPSAEGIQGSITGLLGGEASAAGDSAGSLLGSKLVSTLKGVLAAAGIGKIISESINAGGALQQSLGGVETLFKDSADKVKGYAAQAYETVGLSANDYMEQTTSFAASLLSSVSHDTDAAAQLANMAMVDMADNANKMGTDMQDIQNAYQGFAKQNYTMLDNLKLGYGGTQAEMQRLLADAEKISGVHYDLGNLADMYSAIHIIQTEMNITGTTAKEAATTLTGSFSAMSAAFQNVLANWSTGANLTEPLTALVETAQTFLLDNLLPMIGSVLAGIPEIVYTLAPEVLQSGTELLTSLAQGFTEGIPAFFADALPQLLSFTEELRANAGQFVDAGLNFITQLLNGLIAGLPQLIAYAPDIIINLAGIINDNMPKILAQGVSVIVQLIAGIVQAVPSLLANWKKIFQAVLSVISAINWLKIGTNILKSVGNGVRNMGSSLLNAFKGGFSSALNWIKSLPSQALQWGKNLIQNFINGLTGKGNVVGNLATAATAGFSLAETASGDDVDWSSVWTDANADIADSTQAMADVTIPAYTKSGNAAASAAKQASTAATTATTAAKAITEALQWSVQDEGHSFAQNAFGQVATESTELTEHMLRSDGTAYNKFTKTITETGKEMVNGVLKDYKLVTKAVTNFDEAGKRLGDTITTTQKVYTEAVAAAREATADLSSLAKVWQTEANKGVLGTFSTLLDAVKKKDWKSIGQWVLGALYSGLAPETKMLIEDTGTALIKQVNSVLQQNMQSIAQQAWQIGGVVFQGVTSNFAQIAAQSGSLVQTLLQTFTSLKAPLAAVAKSISAGLSGGLLSEIPTILAAMGGMIASIGGAFTAMLEAIGATLSACGIPTGPVMIAAGVALVAAIAAIVAAVGGAFSYKKPGTTGSSTSTGTSGTLWDYELPEKLPERQQRPNIEVNQYIYSKAQTAADLMREAQYEQERAVLQGV